MKQTMMSVILFGDIKHNRMVRAAVPSKTKVCEIMNFLIYFTQLKQSGVKKSHCVHNVFRTLKTRVNFVFLPICPHIITKSFFNMKQEQWQLFTCDLAPKSQIKYKVKH